MTERDGDEEIRRLNALLGADFRSTRQARRWRSQTIVSRKTGLKRGVISKIEHGDPARLYHYQTYASALGMRLGLVPDRGSGPDGEGSIDATVTTLAARVLSVILEVDRYPEDVVDRRQLIVSLAALLLDSAAPRSLRQLITERSLPLSSADDVDALADECTRYLAAQNAASGDEAVCDIAVAMHQQATAWLELGGHSPRLKRSLESLSCELGAWAGWLMLDAGRLRLADRYLERSLVQARITGNQETEAYVLDSMYTLLKRRGHLERSHQAARLGLQLATQVESPRLKALFHLRLAKITARIGDCSSFKSYAVAAQAGLAASEGSTSPAWLSFLTTGAYDLGDAYFTLGRAEEAAAAFRSIAADPQSNYHRDVVHARVREAHALALMGDLSCAGEVGLAALSHASALTSFMVQDDLRSLRTSLSQQAPAPSKARQFVAAYDELIAARA